MSEYCINTASCPGILVNTSTSLIGYVVTATAVTVNRNIHCVHILLYQCFFFATATLAWFVLFRTQYFS